MNTHQNKQMFRIRPYSFEVNLMARENSYTGKQIGNYRIIEELARGSFGGVYKGVHIFFSKRVVAIKVLQRMYLGSQKEREGFLQEAQFLELLKHPHILPIYDVGIDDGIPYFVAEYAPKGSLRDLLQRRYPHPLSTDEAVSILTQIGQALSMPTSRILFTVTSNRKIFSSMPKVKLCSLTLALLSCSKRQEHLLLMLLAPHCTWHLNNLTGCSVREVISTLWPVSRMKC